MELKVWISGTGRSVPARLLTTEAIEDARLLPHSGLTHGAGVLSRPVCDGEDQISLAVAPRQAA